MPFALQTTKQRRARIHENETARARDLWEIDVELLEPDIAEQNSSPAWETAPANIDHATEFLHRFQEQLDTHIRTAAEGCATRIAQAHPNAN